MKIVEVKIYSFNELSMEAQQKVIKNLYDINVYDDTWHECILEEFTAQLNEKGFLDAEIFFSGFWSQGDGLCFDAKIDVEKFTNKRLSYVIENYSNIYISKTNNSNLYSHEKTRYIDYEPTGRKNIDTAIEKLANEIESERLSICKDFYRQLEKAYEDLCSEESIIETIEANNYEFTEAGNRY